MLAELAGHLPEGPALFPEEIYTEQVERFIAAEIIRERVFLLAREEVPYSTAVVVEEFREGPDITVIKADICVERESQKGILIGAGGSMIKRIGEGSRRELEAILGRRLFLELRVKVKEGWRDDPAMLRSFGYGKPE
jgi:GTP-binding protein Era